MRYQRKIRSFVSTSGFVGYIGLQTSFDNRMNEI